MAVGNANGEDTATGAGSGLGSLVDMTGGSGISSPTHDPFAVTSGTSMNGATGVLGGTSASAMAGFGSGGSPSSALASRRNRVTNGSSGYKGGSVLAGALMLVALLAL